MVKIANYMVNNATIWDTQVMNVNKVSQVRLRNEKIKYGWYGTARHLSKVGYSKAILGETWHWTNSLNKKVLWKYFCQMGTVKFKHLVQSPITCGGMFKIYSFLN